VRRPKSRKRTNEVGVDVAGEVADAAGRDRPVVVEVATIVVGDPAGLGEDAKASPDETTVEVEVVSDLPP
jgi:hypothetical protein